LRFLQAEGSSQWELFAPVQATNRWVRLQGWSGQSSPQTNRLIITVFTPRKMLYKQDMLTKDSPSTNYVHFLDGNRVVGYKSKSDNFTYDVLENRLEEIK
jgi:hypothetical protein